MVGHSDLSCLRVRHNRRYQDLAMLIGSPYQHTDVVSHLVDSLTAYNLVTVQDEVLV